MSTGPHLSAQLAKERADLAKAEQDIREGQQRITELELKIEWLRSEGRSTAQAESMLRIFRDTLVEWHKHRREILKTINRLQTNPS
jgi:chromosome segregation ATPase